MTDEVEVDKMWLFVERKKDQRWLWHVINHRRGNDLAYVFGRRQDEVFLKLKALLEPFGTRVITQIIGTRTRIISLRISTRQANDTHNRSSASISIAHPDKRLARKTICFSKSIQMRDIVIGLCINRYEFGLGSKS